MLKGNLLSHLHSDNQTILIQQYPPLIAKQAMMASKRYAEKPVQIEDEEEELNSLSFSPVFVLLHYFYSALFFTL